MDFIYFTCVYLWFHVDVTVVKRVHNVMQKLHVNICKQDDETELKNGVETLLILRGVTVVITSG